MTPDRMTLFMNFFLVLPVLLFFPGFVLSKTFLVLPPQMHFCEKLFARILLSLIISSFLGIVLAVLAFFSPQNLILGVVVSSFVCFLCKRFKFYSGLLSLRFHVEDVIAIAVFFGGMVFFFWPSEQIGTAFALGRHLASEGSFEKAGVMSSGTILMKGPLISVWYAVVDSFFGIKAGLLTAPAFSVLSLWGLFFLAKRWTRNTDAGFMAAILYVTHFTVVWLGRLPEGFSLCQLMMLAALYFARFLWEEKSVAFLIPSLAALMLAFLAWPDVFWNLIPVISGFVFLMFGISRNSNSLNSEKSSSDSASGWASEGILKFLTVSCLGFWIWTCFRSFESGPFPVPLLYWVLACFGLFRMVYSASDVFELAGWTGFLVAPWIFYRGDLNDSNFLEPLISLFFPAVFCFSACFLSYLSSFNRWTRWGMLFTVVLGTLLPVYWERDVFFAKDFDGTLNFYDKLKRSFLPNDLIFSNDPELASLMWNLFDLKVYVLPSEGLDEDFQMEIRRWLKDGGKAFILSKSGSPMMPGFDVRLESVERLRTLALKNVLESARQRESYGVSIQIYEAVPVTSPE